MGWRRLGRGKLGLSSGFDYCLLLQMSVWENNIVAAAFVDYFAVHHCR